MYGFTLEERLAYDFNPPDPWGPLKRWGAKTGNRVWLFKFMGRAKSTGLTVYEHTFLSTAVCLDDQGNANGSGSIMRIRGQARTLL